HASGAEVLTAIVAAYEMSNKIMAALGGNRGLSEHGLGSDAIARPCALALAGGWLMGLDEEQLVNAAGIATTFGVEPRVVVSPSTRYHLRSPMPALNGMFGLLLARSGYPGPADAFEGKGGIAQLLDGDIDLDALRMPREDWTILYTGVNTTSVDGDVAGI